MTIFQTPLRYLIIYAVHVRFACIYSSQQSAKKRSTSSRKRRRDQNEEVHELASLVPLSSSQLGGLIPSNGGKPQTISVLRLATAFLKLQTFIKDGELIMLHG